MNHQMAVCTYVGLSVVTYKSYTEESNAVNVGAVWDAAYSRQRDLFHMEQSKELPQ